MAYGVGDEGILELKNAGAKPDYSQIWVGSWIQDSGWGHTEDALREAKREGVTPLILFYYWGDSISPNAVKYGAGSKTMHGWDTMAKDLARRAKAIMGSSEFIVVLEPEFNKQGITEWEAFDGYLADHARMIKNEAWTAKIVIGFGHWGGWDRFDRAMAEAHYSGTQWMRGSTRDAKSGAENSAAEVLKVVKSLKSTFGKGVILYDLAISSYGGWESAQERAIQGFADRKGELEAAGLKAVVWRTVKDNDHSSGYYGAAEKNWGVKHSWGGGKPAWDNLVNLIKGSSGAASGGSSSPPSGSSGVSSSGSVFSDVGGNEWWVQATVSGSPWKVEARVDGGSWTALAKQSWGAHAGSVKAPHGSTVEFRAHIGGGTESAAYKWPDAMPATASSGGGSSGGITTQSGDVFSEVKGNRWWIQANVEGSPSRVDARVDGGPWLGMKHESWGAWTVSTSAPEGARVELRATFGGASKTAAYSWTEGDAKPAGSGSSPPAPSGGSSFDATFDKKQVLEWWVQVGVTGTKSISKVDVRVNGGSWTPLAKQSWGDWAGSVHVNGGQKVEFRATASDGSTDISQGYWR